MEEIEDLSPTELAGPSSQPDANLEEEEVKKIQICTKKCGIKLGEFKVETSFQSQIKPMPRGKLPELKSALTDGEKSRRKKGFLQFAEDTKPETNEGPDGSEFHAEMRRKSSVSGDLDVSIRGKIRAKLKTAVAKTETQERFKHRLTQLKQKTEDSDALNEDFEEANLAVERALEKSFDLRSKLRKNVAKTQPLVVPASEQFEFFTSTYEEPKKAKESAKPQFIIKKETSKNEDEIEDAEETDKSYLLRGFDDSQTVSATTLTRAIPVRRKQLKNESELYFYPSFLPVTAGDKMIGTVEKWAEEGLYVGGELPISDRNINTMEQRLIRQPDRGQNWFGADGKINRIPPPIANFPSRPEDSDSVLNLTEYRKATVRSKRLGVGDGIYQLDIDVGKVVFTHHHLFAKENLLGMRLINYYRDYMQRSEENLAELYSHKIRGLKMAVDQMLSETSDISMANRIKLYRAQIKETRELKNREDLLDKQTLQAILDAWASLKNLRIQQGYNCTSLQLYLKLENVDPTDDQNRWKAELNEELLELEHEYNANFNQQMEIYNKSLGKGKSKKAKGVDKSSDTESNTSGISMVKPQPFNKAEMWEKLMENARINRRNPGESKIIPILASGVSITPLDKCPKEEQERRKSVDNCQIHLEIYFNGKEVCRSSQRPITTEFVAAFGQIYNLHIYEWPQTITVKIFETTEDPTVEICQLFLPVPNTSQISSNGSHQSRMEEFQFGSDLTRNYLNSSAVGSGYPVEFGNLHTPGTIPRTSGILQGCAVWGRDKNGIPLVPPFKDDSELDETNNISPKNLAALKEIQEKLKNSKFDPNDPLNRKLLGVLNDITAVSTENVAKIDSFRLIPPECEFMSDEEFMANPRLRLLELRNQQVPEFRNLRMIPALVKEIPADIFNAYEQKLMKEKERIDVTDMDAYRAVVNRYISSVREEILLRLKVSKVTRLLQDVVSEDPIPNFGSLGFAFAADVGRPLKPLRKERKKIVAQNIAGLQVKVLVNVIRAICVPSRISKSESSSSTHTVKEVTLEPFVEVTFQNSTQRTSHLEGTNPTWNQQLIFDFKAPNNDFSTGNVQTVTDVVYFNLYDHDSTELPKDSRDGTSVIHRQVEKRWLGSFKIPFSTVYQSGKPIHGTFRLNVPPVLLGYKLDSSSDVKFPHLELIVAVDPPLIPPEPIHSKNLESVETPKLREYANDWLSSLEKTYSGRRFVPLVIDMNGRAVCVCRFLRDIPPPPEIMEIWSQNQREALNLACRIVSLIPFVSDPVLFPGLCDIWTTCEQFLKMLCGDEEEHSVLLCCWLLGLGVESALVLGLGLPEGPHSAYVLAKLAPEAILLNPSTGQTFSLGDPLCPLTSVGCVVTKENLYANIQPKTHPSVMTFDFGDVTMWRPFFQKNFPNPGLTSIQTDLVYRETSRENSLKLQERIETAIKERIFAWRSKTLTRMNVYAVQIFRQLLSSFETGMFSTDHEETHNEALKSLMETHKISGFPLNSSYSTTEDLIELVRSTNVHENYHPDVEFALAVHIHPYSNGILSVWVYIASLIKKR